MKFDFTPQQQTICINNKYIIYKSIFKILYYYDIELFNGSLSKILDNEDVEFLLKKTSLSIKTLILILKLLKKIFHTEISFEEKLTLEQYILNSLNFEISLLNDIEIVSEENFLLWFEKSLEKLNNQQKILNNF